MYNKNNFAIHKIASKSQMQPALGTVAFYGNRSVATDSFRLIEVSAWGEKHEPKLFTGDAIKKIKLDKKTPKTEVEDQTEHVQLKNVQYPDIDKVTETAFRECEDSELYTSVKLNAELLEGLLSVMKKMNRFSIVTLSVPREKGKAITIKTETTAQGASDKQTARALLMPTVK